MGTAEQLIRIALNAAGSSILGAGIVQGEQYQTGVGAVISLISVGWWYFQNRHNKST